MRAIPRLDPAEAPSGAVLTCDKNADVYAKSILLVRVH